MRVARAIQTLLVWRVHQAEESGLPLVARPPVDNQTRQSLCICYAIHRYGYSTRLPKNATVMNNKTYTVTALAREVGLSPSTVRKMLREKRIPEPERDWRDYRVFNERDLHQLRALVSATTPRPPFHPSQPANAQSE